MLAKRLTVIFTILAISAPVPAFAYIDPGTGSILIQGIIAAVAAVGVTLKLYWHRFVRFFRRDTDESRSDKDEAANAAPAARDQE